MIKTQQSIFGPTAQGVPNPIVPHVHPYPTRYHGPNFIQPQASFSYREQPYLVPPRNPLQGSPDGIGQGETKVVSSPEYQSYTESLKERLGPWATVYQVASFAGAALGAYHGYARNDSIGWGVWWFLMGGMFPIITIPLSLAQGFGKPHVRHVVVDE